MGNRRRRRRRRRFLIILISLVVIGIDVTLFIIQPWKKQAVTIVANPSPIPINHKITNDMSALDQTQRFDRKIENFINKWDIKGASFALMKDDKLVYAKGYGYADAESGERCEVKHLFRVASVSKLITAAAVMKLYENGELRLDDKVFGEDGILNDSMFLNISDKRVKSITVEHLLRHSGGFSHRIGDPMFNHDIVARTLQVSLPLSMNDLVRYAAESKLRTLPGSSTSYSNLGYLILSKIVEKSSGQEYETFVKNEILIPAGCFDMYIGANRSSNRRKNEVKYYEVHDAEPIEAYDGSGKLLMKSNGGNDVAGLYGAGGWIASPVELIRFIASVDGNSGKSNILSKKSIDIMTEFNKNELPIGWAKVTQNDEWIRSGSLAGTSAFIKRQNNGYTWVFLTNTSSWKGANFTHFINTEVSNAITKVDGWPERDMFIEQPTILMSKTTNGSSVTTNFQNAYCCY